MADVAVERPTTPSLRSTGPPSSFPDINSTEVLGAQDGDQYTEYKRLQQELEYINLQEEYIKDEQRYVRPATSRPGDAGRWGLTQHQESEAGAGPCTGGD